ncbi:alpha/beta fold hydrolase, partial [Enterobacter asburiae]
MKLSVSPPPYEGAPVVVFISGLGGSGSYWLPQLAALEPEYQVVCYDQLGTGNNPATLPEDYSLAQMADELARALADAGIVRYSVVGLFLIHTSELTRQAAKPYAVFCWKKKTKFPSYLIHHHVTSPHFTALFLPTKPSSFYHSLLF